MQSYVAIKQLYSWAKAILSSERGEGEKGEGRDEEEGENKQHEEDEDGITSTMQSYAAMKQLYLWAKAILCFQ